MTPSKIFEELPVWQAAKTVVVAVYRLTGRPLVSRDFGFSSHIQRASVSIMSNVAEGFERGGNREFIQFLYIAKGSAGEVRSLITVGQELGYLTEEDRTQLRNQLVSISRQLGGFIKYLERDLAAKAKPAKS